jgi:membrane protease YdiL (CAAX protease family)
MARSFKEAQTLLTPVYFLCFTPSLIAGLGDWELGGAAAVVPGVNVTLLARDLILGKATFFTSLLVVASTVAFGALALSLAARLYDSERLLAADEGALPLFAWVRRLVGLEGRGPAVDASIEANPGQSLALFGIGFLLVLLAGRIFMRHLTLNILATQWVGMFGLVALYARSLGRPLKEVLRLRPVPGRALAGATLIGLSAWLVLGMLAQWFLKPPKELEESMRHLVMPNDGSRGVGLTILLVGLTPAICEESLFRGAILRGFSARLPRMTSAVLTGVLFGLFHLDLWRLLPTALLGVGLSLIALETGSIIPSMLAHFLNNACLIVLAYLGHDDVGGANPGLTTQVGLFLGGLVVLVTGAALLRGTGAEPTNS